MKDCLKKLANFKKHLLTMLLTSNLILVSTGSAMPVSSTPSLSLSPTPQVTTVFPNPISPSPTVTNAPSIPSASPNNSKLKKIDPTGKFIEDEIVIRYKENIQETKKESIASANDTQVSKDLPHSRLKILSVNPAKREKAIENLKKDPDVEYVGHNFATGISSTPNDPVYPQQWHLNKINAPSTWSSHEGGPAIKVAVVDTGINYNLAEFGLVENGGRVIKGRDAYNGDDDPMDDNGHGTLVAGVMGAKTNNGVDVASVDWNAQIIAVKVLASNGTGGSAELAEGLQWLVDTNPAGLKVVNLSLWNGDDDPNVRSVIGTLVNRGIIVVVGTYNSSPGNSNCDALPLAKYPGVVAVVATDENDTHWSGCTQGGIQGYLMAAPGHNIWTEYALGGAISQSGTSFAAPQVAGAASILFSCPGNPSRTIVINALLQGTDLGASGYDDVYGYGRLDMFNAIQNVPGCLPPFLPMGDVDCNGVVNVVDAIHILRYVAGWEPAGDNCGAGMIFYPNADVDGNGSVDTIDALQIFRYVAGLPSPLNNFVGSASAMADNDGDGFSNGIEQYIGTDSNARCGVNAWPPDINGDNIVTLADVLLFIPRFNAIIGDPNYDKRFDLNVDGRVALQDILTFIPYFNKHCSSL